MNNKYYANLGCSRHVYGAPTARPSASGRAGRLVSPQLQPTGPCRSGQAQARCPCAPAHSLPPTQGQGRWLPPTSVSPHRGWCRPTQHNVSSQRQEGSWCCSPPLCAGPRRPPQAGGHTSTAQQTLTLAGPSPVPRHSSIAQGPAPAYPHGTVKPLPHPGPSPAVPACIQPGRSRGRCRDLGYFKAFGRWSLL